MKNKKERRKRKEAKKKLPIPLKEYNQLRVMFGLESIREPMKEKEEEK